MHYILLFLALACSGYCIEGQVFIVTESGNNIKLGLVPIGIYSRETVEKYVRTHKAELLPETLKTEAIVEKHRKASLNKDKPLAARNDDVQTAIQGLKLLQLTIAYFYSDFPKEAALARTKTDADGRFKLEGDFSGDVVLVAFARRTVGDADETYSWTLPASEWETPLFLSNYNTTTVSTLRPIAELFTGDKKAARKFFEKEYAAYLASQKN